MSHNLQLKMAFVRYCESTKLLFIQYKAKKFNISPNLLGFFFFKFLNEFQPLKKPKTVKNLITRPQIFFANFVIFSTIGLKSKCQITCDITNKCIGAAQPAD